MEFRTLYRWAYAGTTAVIAAIVLLMFLRHPGMTGHYRCTFPDMIYGKAYKPFVCRALVPFTIRTVAKTVPRERRLEFSHQLGANHWIALFQKKWSLRWEPDFLFEYLVAAGVLYGFLLAFMAAVRHLARGVFDAPPAFADFASLAAVLGLPPMFRYYSHVYDFGTLFFFTLCLGLMVRRKWTAYVAVFVLACLNKETTILLAGIFFLHFRRDLPRPLFARLLAFQVGAFVAVKSALNFYFRANLGGMVESHLLDNLLLIKPYPVADAVAWLILGGLIVHAWDRKPLFLKHAALALVPLVGLTVLFGMLDEFRDYYEAYPPLLLLAAQSFALLLGVPVTARTDFDRGLR